MWITGGVPVAVLVSLPDVAHLWLPPQPPDMLEACRATRRQTCLREESADPGTFVTGSTGLQTETALRRWASWELREK